MEKNLGMILPLDYKKFINKYGTGSINDFIWILNPFSENENLNLIKKGHVIREAYAYSKNNSQMTLFIMSIPLIMDYYHVLLRIMVMKYIG